MDYTFLNTEAEAYALYVSVLCYFAAIAIVLSSYLKNLRNKKLEESTLKSMKRRTRILAIVTLLICSVIHTSLFYIFFEMFPEKTVELKTEPRPAYYISILLTLAVFSLFMWFGMFLKGTSTLPKQQGPVTGV